MTEPRLPTRSQFEFRPDPVGGYIPVIVPWQHLVWMFPGTCLLVAGLLAAMPS